jgi:O-antigen/teichoic acid export membrane protein
MAGVDLEKYFRDLWTVGAGMALAMAIDFVFYFLTGRLLGPEEFGVFGSVMAIFYVTVRSPFKSLEMTSKKIEAEGRDAISVLGRPTLKLGFGTWLLFLLVSPVLASVLTIPLNALLVFSLIFPTAYLLPVLLGRLHGQQRFREYALYEIVSSAIAFSAIGFVLYGLGASGAVAAPVLEVLAGGVLVYIFLRPVLGSERFRDRKLLFRSVVQVFAVSAAFSIDIVLLKFFKTSATVGLYNAVAVFGKGIFFSAVALNRSVFPKFVQEADGRFNLLNISLLLLSAGSVFAYGFFRVFGETLITFTFGQQYAAAASFAPLYMLFISAVSAVALVGNYYLSFDRERLWLILLMPLLQFAGILLFHETVIQVVKVGLVSALVVLAVLYLPVLKLDNVDEEPEN